MNEWHERPIKLSPGKEGRGRIIPGFLIFLLSLSLLGFDWNLAIYLLVGLPTPLRLLEPALHWVSAASCKAHNDEQFREYDLIFA